MDLSSAQGMYTKNRRGRSLTGDKQSACFRLNAQGFPDRQQTGSRVRQWYAHGRNGNHGLPVLARRSDKGIGMLVG